MYIIDFSIHGLNTENRLPSQRTPTPYKIKVNNCKLLDLVIRIELTRAILMPRFSNFLRNSTIHFLRIFFYLETCSHGVSKKHVPIYPELISEGRRNFSTL